MLLHRFILFLLLPGFVACGSKPVPCANMQEKQIGQTGFHSLQVDRHIQVTVTKSDSFMVSVRGCADDVEALAINKQPDGLLQLDWSGACAGHHEVNVFITLPALQEIRLSGNALAILKGFDTQPTEPRVLTDNNIFGIEATAPALHKKAAVNRLPYVHDGRRAQHDGT